METEKPHRNLKTIIQLIGWGLFLFGLFALYVGPLEIYSYYLFTSGGKHHFEGFEFGSFMFGYITVQVFGYYALAITGIILGYGHIKIRRWVRKTTLTLLWDWLILGLPLSIVMSIMLLSSKNVSLNSLPFLAIVVLLIYPVLPLLLVRFYNSQTVHNIFNFKDQNVGWFDQTPQAILTLSGLLIFSIAALHVPFFFNGIFPVFGQFVVGLNGFKWIDCSIILLCFLTWGILNKKIWAWWGSILYFVLITVSTTLSIFSVPLTEIIALMNFAPFEQEMFKAMPFKEIHLWAFFVLPVIVILGVVLATRQSFNKQVVKSFEDQS